MNIGNKTNKVINSRYAVPILLGLSFISPLIICFNTLIGAGGLHSPYYFVGYETGFGGRKLIGTLFGLFLPENIHHCHITPFVFFAFLLLASLFIFFVSHALKLKELKTSTAAQAVFLLLAVYLISNYSIFNFIASSAWFIDIYLYLATIAFVFLYINCRGKWYYYIGTAILALTGCLIHHIFCCLFFPMIVALFINEIFAKNEFHINRLIYYGVISLLLLLLFFAIWLSSSPMDIDALYENVCKRANGVCIKEKVVFQWLYGSNHGNYLAMWDEGHFPLRYYQFIPVVILMSPILALFCTPWILSIKNATKGVQQTKYLLMFLAQTILFFPIFIIATDYFRWWYAWFFCQTIIIITMYKIKDAFFIEQLEKIISWTKKNWIISILLTVYICKINIGNCGVSWVDTLFSLI